MASYPFTLSNRIISLMALNLSLSIVPLTQLTAQNWDIELLDKLNQAPEIDPDKGWIVFSKNACIIDVSTPLSIMLIGKLKKDNDLTHKGLAIGSSYVATAVLTLTLKNIIKRPRPHETYPTIIYAKSSTGSYAFPSGHTSSAFSTATSLSLAFPKWYVTVPAFAYASAVGYSRMDLGVHYPSDVLAGALLGSSTAYLTFKMNKALQKNHKSRKKSN